jgi:hypothetical protein
MTASGAPLADLHQVGEPAALDQALQFFENSPGAQAPTAFPAFDGQHDRAWLTRTHGDHEPT